MAAHVAPDALLGGTPRRGGARERARGGARRAGSPAEPRAAHARRDAWAKRAGALAGVRLPICHAMCSTRPAMELIYGAVQTSGNAVPSPTAGSMAHASRYSAAI